MFKYRVYNIYELKLVDDVVVAVCRQSKIIQSIHVLLSRDICLHPTAHRLQTYLYM